jgi:ATP-dependent Clp protease ATP-binding subunit ClpA
MRLLRRPTRPRAKTMRPPDRYLAAGADEARRLGHNYIGTEHVLLALTRNPESRATRVLRQLGVTHGDIKDSATLTRLWAPRIDPDALATLGIDLEAVRQRLEETFGPSALEQTRAGMLEQTRAGIRCVAPRLKLALEYALEHAGEPPVQDEHVLLGLLSVPDSLAARALAELGVSLEEAEEIMRGGVS